MSDWILEIPEWQGRIVFARGTVTVCLVVGVLAAGIFTCACGYQYLQTMCLVLAGFGIGGLAVSVMDSVTEHEIAAMLFFVTAVFFGELGCCVLLKFLKRVPCFGHRDGGRRWRAGFLPAAGAFLGAAVVSGVLYLQVYRNAVFCVLLFAVLFVWSYRRGKRRAAVEIYFYTYEDLYRMNVPQEGEGGND